MSVSNRVLVKSGWKPIGRMLIVLPVKIDKLPLFRGLAQDVR